VRWGSGDSKQTRVVVERVMTNESELLTKPSAGRSEFRHTRFLGNLEDQSQSQSKALRVKTKAGPDFQSLISWVLRSLKLFRF